MTMSEQEGMDRLLRQELGTTVPELSADFERRILTATRPRRLSTRGVVMLSLYTVFAIVVSVSAMRASDVGWVVIGAASVTPVAIAAAGLRSRLVAALAR
jgi:hypothetical protein